MKINQEYQFRPITLTLEHKWEAIALWDALTAINGLRSVPCEETKFLVELANWFSNQAQL